MCMQCSSSLMLLSDSDAAEDLSTCGDRFLLLGSHLHHGFRSFQRNSCFRHRIRHFRHRAPPNQQRSQSDIVFKRLRSVFEAISSSQKYFFIIRKYKKIDRNTKMPHS